MDQPPRVMQKVYWKDVSAEVHQINPELAHIIDNLDPDKNYPLIRANYLFGDMIVDNGTTYLPNANSDLLPISDPSLQPILKNLLNYSTIPLFLTLENANEVFIQSLNRSVPLNLFYPGSLLGVFETMDYFCNMLSTSEWCVSAGARNLFILAKMNEIAGLKRLKAEYNTPSSLTTRYLADQWQLFRHIARHENFSQSWQNQVLFFTEPWMQDHPNDSKWHHFRNYIFKIGCIQAKFAISKNILGLGWRQFSEVISAKNLKPIPYIADQLKHILLVAAGVWIGIRAADSSDQVAPTQGLQKALTEVYLLKKYLPTFMHITSLEKEGYLPKYYSLSYPTILEGSPMNQSSTSTMMIDLREIKYLLETIKPTFTEVNKGMFRNADFDFFHVENDKYNEIRPSTELVSLDQNLLINQQQFPDREFCATSQFWRGCLRILRKP